MKTKIQFSKKLLPFKIIYLCCMLILTANVDAKSTPNNQNNESKNISLNIQNAPITKVFTVIEQKTNFTFIFDNNITKTNQKFTVNATKESLKTILAKITNQSGFRFAILNNTITVLESNLQQLVKGKVVDRNNMSLPGASVLEIGTKNATTTDFDGKFNLTLTSKNALLEISYMGYTTRTIAAVPGTMQEIILQENINDLNEVVVTALGIKREEKKLGFSQATIGSEVLAQTMPNNWSSGLQGKVAGLNIVSSGSGPLNSQQITLRGNNSLNANGNNALIVVDGVPVNSEMTTSGSTNSYVGEDSPIDYGNGISDLNLEDIESVTVLKGPGATALYGSRAANGALIITTKSGKKSNGLGITYNSSVSFDVIQRWPDWQYKYGQGTGKSFDKNGIPYYSYGASIDGSNTGSTSSAWGPAFDSQSFYQYDATLEGQSAERELWQSYSDNRKDFWKTGITTNNNITIQGSNEKGSMRLSVGHSKNEWIMPNTGYERLTAAVNANYEVSDFVKIGSVVNYNNRTSDNLPSTGYNNGSIAYFMIFQNPNVDLDWYRNIWKNGQEQIQQIQPFSSFIDNPYLIAYEATNALASNQIVGNIFSNIKFSPKLGLLLRTSLNSYYQERDQKRPYSINRYKQGFYEAQDVWKQEVNSDFLLSYEEKLSKKITLSASIGGNAMDYKYRRTDAYVTGLVVPGVYKLANGINSPIIQTYDKNKKVNSLYGLFSFSFNNKVFLDLTGRNDWSSSLPVKNNSFFYPSANASFVVSEIFKLPKTFNFVKYRFSYAQVGNDTDPYKTSKYYNQSAFPSSASVPGDLYNADFKPEITTSYETGIEGRLFNNRINFDATVYETNTKNQIISVPLDITTGYSSGVLNSGEVRNRGIELTFGGKLIKSNKFSWTSTLTWSKNWNQVIKLADGISGQQEIGSGGNATLLAKVGGTTTAIYGYGFERSPEGKIVYSSAGLPVYPTEIQHIGDANPDWKAGLNNSFRLGNVTFNFVIDGQYGGIIYSQTHHKSAEQGKLTSTFMGRENGYIIGDGVVLNTDGTYSPNTTKAITPDWYASYYRRANVESNSFDASFVKLREVSIQYDFPKQLLKNTGISALNLSVFGRNLGIISDFPIYDPETAALNGDTILPGIEMGQMPSPATYGFSLKLNL
ncbi:SusC/RagA family TonB-linked outer membrane protein [Flavobacterium algicola]|uniref:SusC/RagA family TonB-linked outer membrane protein n=1 Tax=Flavobacterium algicola TaxID=556529 RepID=UPI001EFDC3E9|nr:SusC/RagA family TonB-linked outer membrane protein [Flavobacterium algicola]MCG9792397.1 SusC/RagA family TonB-linked outer membrane protein [Flavobacterium algicola]